MKTEEDKINRLVEIMNKARKSLIELTKILSAFLRRINWNGVIRNDKNV